MSFYINNTNPHKPGPIQANGLNAVCEKVLIETTKVFDACMNQTQIENKEYLKNITNYELPYDNYFDWIKLGYNLTFKNTTIKISCFSSLINIEKYL